MEEIIVGALLGAQDGLQQRENREMLRQGIQPRFWQRHPMLPYVLGVLLAVPAWLLFMHIASVIPWWMHTAIVIDRHLGGTGLVAVFLWTWPVWALMLRAFWRSERRWNMEHWVR